MKRNSKILVILALVLCLVMALSGCGAKTELAAQVGDREVTVAQIENYYQSTASMAYYYYGYDTTTEEGRAGYVDYIAETLIYSQLLSYKAEQAGITLTAEEQAEAQATAEADYEAFYQDFLDYAEQQGAQDVEAYANELLTDTLVQNKTTVKKLKENYLNTAIDTMRVEKHREQLLEGVAPTAEQLLEMYEEEVALQTEQLAEDASSYFTQESYYNYGYSYMPLVVPEGLFYVRHILVEDEETAQTVMDRINEGEDFEELLTEYNLDPGMTGSDYAEGYVVGEGASFVEEFLTAALQLKEEGEVCMTQSSYGYHIIKRMGLVPARVIPYEEVQTTFDVLATENFLNTYYNNIAADWLAEEGLVVRYEEAYASVGK